MKCLDEPYDADRYLTADGKQTYTYDGENRLSTVTPLTVVVGSKKVEFAYDYRNRRVQKRVWTWSQSQVGGDPYVWSLTEDRRFIYDGWNLLMELNARNSHIPMTKFTWGLDLSGQSGNASVSGLHGAGGIGGLLAMADTKDNPEPWDDVQHVYFYDANGNVGQVMDVRAGSAYYGQAVAKYEYYPFGGNLVSGFVRNSSGPKNPFMFSTKYRDSETGLYYFGYRYLIPRLGRWTNRDPIGELGGLNLYGSFVNSPANVVDTLGLWNRDFHFDLVFELAIKAGFCCPGTLAAASNRPDEDERRAGYEGLVNDWLWGGFWSARKGHPEHVVLKWLQMRWWHFPADPDGVVRPGSDAAKSFMSEGIRKCDLWAFGEGLHRFTDSWAHQGKPPVGGIGHDWGALPLGDTDDGGDLRLRGYSAALSHSADDLKVFPGRARAAAIGAHRAMLDFKNNCPCACPRTSTWLPAEPLHLRISLPNGPTSCGPGQKTTEVRDWLRWTRLPGEDKVK